MANLLENRRENTEEELTDQLACSLKKSLLVPVKNQWRSLEQNIDDLQKLEADNRQQTLQLSQQLTGLENTLAALTKQLHAGIALITVLLAALAAIMILQ